MRSPPAASCSTSNTGEVLAMVSLPDFDPNNPVRCARQGPAQPHVGGHLRDGLDLQELHHRHGARFRQGHAERHVRRIAPAPRSAASPSTTSTASSRVLTVPEVFIYSSNIGTAQDGRRRSASTATSEFLHRIGLLDKMQTELPEVATPIEPQGVEEDQLDHHLLRPRRVDDAAADRGRRGGADEWRQADRADLPAAHAGGGRLASPSRWSARKPATPCAISIGSTCVEGLRQARRGARLPRRRQDRHGRKGRRRPLFRRQALQRLPRGFPDRRSASMSCWSSSTNRSRKKGNGRGHCRPQCAPMVGNIIRRSAAMLGREARFRGRCKTGARVALNGFHCRGALPNSA